MRNGNAGEVRLRGGGGYQYVVTPVDSHRCRVEGSHSKIKRCVNSAPTTGFETRYVSNNKQQPTRY